MGRPPCLKAPCFSFPRCHHICTLHFCLPCRIPLLLTVAVEIFLVLFFFRYDTATSFLHPTMAVDPQADFVGDIKVNNNPPTKATLEKVAELPVLDSDKKSRTFKSLYADNEDGPQRVLIIFIRHFFCGVRSPFSRPSQQSELPLTNYLPQTELPRIPPRPRSRHPPFLPRLPHTPDLNRNNRLRSTRTHPHVHTRNIMSLPHLRRPHPRPVPQTRHDANPIARPQDAFLYPETLPHSHHRGFLQRTTKWEKHVKWGCAKAGRRRFHV